ncbi:hypothetical protein V8F33_002648 [Rhypophila sp. PSN 637]
MPSYTIRYPHPVSKVTWYPVDQGIRINIFATADEISPPKSPELSAQEQGRPDVELDHCHRPPSAISLEVHQSGLDWYRRSSPAETAELVLPESIPPSPVETTETNSVTILTPSHTSGTMFESKEIRSDRDHEGEGNMTRKDSACLSINKLATLQDVLAEERKHRPTLEERVKMPIVPVPRTVQTGRVIASFDLAFPELHATDLGSRNADRKFDVSWEESD